jgi:hypothetical protein
MSRHLLFVLLLATGIALADSELEPERGASAAEPQAKTEAAQGRTKQAQTRAEEAQGRAEKAQTQTNRAPARTEEAQGQTEEEQEQAKEEAKLIPVPGGTALGMSILGNQEAPKSLVIVPWKSSELGDLLGLSPMLDDSKQPVDKEVFMRALRYYEIRSGKRP